MDLKLTGQWEPTIRTLDAAPRIIGDGMKKAVSEEGKRWRDEIIEGLKRQAPGGKRFKPLDPDTIEARKAEGDTSTKVKLLPVTPESAIVVKPIRDGVFIGVPAGARAGGSASLVLIASVQEEGTRDGRIPPRPFIAPVAEKATKEGGDRLVQSLRRDFEKAFSR